MKILFLDMDGVMNSHQSAYYYRKLMNDKPELTVGIREEICPIALANLHRIVSETGCKIVISSTWRLGSELEEMKGWFYGFNLIQDAIIDKTPNIKVKGNTIIHNVPRGLEIKVWMEDNGHKTWKSNEFAILDDDSDMWPLAKNFFQTDAKVGLDFITASKVIDFLEDRVKMVQC